MDNGDRPEWYSPSVGNALSCNHSTLTNTQSGTEFYHCAECDWIFYITTAKVMPKDHLVLTAFGQLGWFARRHGVKGVLEALRKPHAMSDGSDSHRPHLPEGVTPVELWEGFHEDYLKALPAEEREAKVLSNGGFLSRVKKALKGKQ